MAVLLDPSAQAEALSRRLIAEDTLKKQVRVGHSQQQEAIKAVLNMSIKDTLVTPAATEFSNVNHTGIEKVMMLVNGALPQSIHPHALTQICDTLGIPRTYVTKLNDGETWEKILLAHNMNQHMHLTNFATKKQEDVKFLHRVVNGELRGFLSRRYNRNLSTGPMLRTFLETCAQHGAGAVEAHTSDVKTTLKCVLPQVFEPIEGEFVAFGITFTNSDFGAGRLKLSGTVMRVASSTISVLEDKYSKVHVGKPILESEIAMTEDTDNKILVAAQAVIRDSVNAILNDDSIETAMRAIQVANESTIPWYKLKDLLNNVLGKKDLELMKTMIDNKGFDVINLPPMHTTDTGDRILSEWGAANLVGWFASKEEDAERKSGLQDVAGKLLKHNVQEFEE